MGLGLDMILIAMECKMLNFINPKMNQADVHLNFYQEVTEGQVTSVMIGNGKIIVNPGRTVYVGLLSASELAYMIASYDPGLTERDRLLAAVEWVHLHPTPKWNDPSKLDWINLDVIFEKTARDLHARHAQIALPPLMKSSLFIGHLAEHPEHPTPGAIEYLPTGVLTEIIKDKPVDVMGQLVRYPVRRAIKETIRAEIIRRQFK